MMIAYFAYYIILGINVLINTKIKTFLFNLFFELPKKHFDNLSEESEILMKSCAQKLYQIKCLQKIIDQIKTYNPNRENEIIEYRSESTIDIDVELMVRREMLHRRLVALRIEVVGKSSPQATVGDTMPRCLRSEAITRAGAFFC